MKKILIVSYYFPPYNGVGGLRSYFLSGFLLNEGFSVTVLKSHDKHFGENIDKNICKLDKQINIKTIDTDQSFINRYFFNYFKFKNTIQRIVEENEISLIIFSGGPFYYFPLGKYFKEHYSIPYILDYRDNFFEKPLDWRGKIYRFLFKNLWDKPSLREASYVVNVTKNLTRLHKKENPKLKENKFVTIFNGYNDRVLSQLSFNKNSKQFKENTNTLLVGIFGKFSYYDKSDVETLLDSLENTDIKLEIYHIGKKEPVFMKLVAEKKEDKNFKFLGYKNYTEGLQILSSMDCLMLNNSQHYALGTKIFDYIYLNKPIIALVEPGSDIDLLLKNFKNNFTIGNQNYIKLAKSFDQIHSLRKKVLTDQETDIQKYSRTYQYNKLLNKINRIL